ncbi:MAG: peptidase, partial [Nitrosopumilales archaeon CG15_BIG_FIL_POST_REV_8_21_14_020_33_23]
ATLEKIKIKTGGFAIFIAMFAGFVEPDEEEFNKAKKISKLRVIGAGATSNVIFALALGLILLTNPFFAMVLPEPLLSTFYDLPDGVLILSIIENSGAEKAGLLANDLITSINGIQILSPLDFQKTELIPGEIANVAILRDGQTLQFPVEVIPSPEDPKRGLIGIMRDNSFAYKPVLNFIEWNDPGVSMFLLWLWMISFFIGIINMLPLPILDGGKFIHTIIDKRISDKAVNTTMWGIYAFTFALFGLNIALSYMKSGWFTI